ncbi:hypothetical protein AVEN_116458-1 [Araneus ventricosus]|uniref:Uncharacterized protein n=1 Tax=Araneus ventricosus TaxID=182803 RepID=A0A4Y2S4N4_ARAVE|nr:hypothetical protein AVEN_116458-1 [Araneus ventricosus]
MVSLMLWHCSEVRFDKQRQTKQEGAREGFPIRAVHKGSIHPINCCSRRSISLLTPTLEREAVIYGASSVAQCHHLDGSDSGFGTNQPDFFPSFLFLRALSFKRRHLGGQKGETR